MIKKEDGIPKFKLLTKKELGQKKDDILKCVNSKNPRDEVFAKYQHYLVPLRETINKYKTYNGNIKLIMNENDRELETSLRESTSGTGKTRMGFMPSLVRNLVTPAFASNRWGWQKAATKKNGDKTGGRKTKNKPL